MSQKAELQTDTGSLTSLAGATPLDKSIERASSFLLSLQHPEGHWLAELEADTTLESDYIGYLHIIGRFDRSRIGKLARYVRDRQRADGGWNIFFNGPSEV